MIYKGRVLFKSWLSYKKLFSGLVAVYSGWFQLKEMGSVQVLVVVQETVLWVGSSLFWLVSTKRDEFYSSLGYCYKKLFSGSVAVSFDWRNL